MQLLANRWHGMPLEPPFFYGTDFKELFEYNLKKQPSDWRWRDRKVYYTINSQGYRCPEFKDINWTESIVMFGCSYVFAPGVDDSETMPSLLSQRLGRPVVNLGAGSTDDLFQFANTNIIYEEGIRPYAVIYLWPGIHRLTEFLGGVDTENWGSWNCHSSGLAKNWITKDNHVRTFLHYLSMSVTNLWKCPILQYYPYMTFHKEGRSLNFFQAKNNTTIDDVISKDLWPNIKPWRHIIDAARDVGYQGNYHPGPDTLKFWVDEILIPDLENLGIQAESVT